jgi:hypothetical protein
MPAIASTSSVGGYTVNLCAFYFYKLIGKLTAFWQLQEFSLRNLPVDSSTSSARRSPHTGSQLKSKVGNILAKAAALRINLNIDGAPIASKSHTHPSHSQTSRLSTSSLFLGVPVATQCMRGVYIDPSALAFSLSSHRYLYIGLLFSSRFIA